ncbi:MAG: Carbohydrate kinase [Bacilli bacterium]|nr:Carbohydrate kinase [Bacilli bacterium]
MRKYALGIDIGTTSVKALLISDHQEIIFEANEAHDLISKHVGWSEEDTEDWWNNTITVISKLLNQVPDAADHIHVIGVSGMVPAIVLLNDKSEPLRNSIQQNDARAVHEIEQLKQSIDQDELFQLTGGYTNQQHVLPRLLWVKENEPEVWSKTSCVLGSYDYITYKLTGTKSIEVNWAVESGLYDIHKQVWLTDKMKEFGIDPALFPNVQLSGEIVGTINREASQKTGLRENIPVIAGSADHVASTLAAGIVEEGDLLIKFGGAGDILYCIEEVHAAPELFFDYHIVPDKYLLNGCMSSSGSLVKWYVKQFLNSDSNEIFKELDEEAKQCGAGADGLIILPYFLGEKTPLFDPKARGVLFGLTLSHGRGHIFRAILEAVIYGFRHHVEVLDKLGYRPRRIFATNGGAKSSFWCQIAADVLKSDIRSFPYHPGSALGVAFLAGMSVGMYTDWAQIHNFLQDYKDYQPTLANSEIYDQTYAIYRNLYGQLSLSFDMVNEIKFKREV